MMLLYENGFTSVPLDDPTGAPWGWSVTESALISISSNGLVVDDVGWLQQVALSGTESTTGEATSIKVSFMVPTPDVWGYVENEDGIMMISRGTAPENCDVQLDLMIGGRTVRIAICRNGIYDTGFSMLANATGYGSPTIGVDLPPGSVNYGALNTLTVLAQGAVYLNGVLTLPPESGYLGSSWFISMGGQDGAASTAVRSLKVFGTPPEQEQEPEPEPTAAPFWTNLNNCHETI